MENIIVLNNIRSVFNVASIFRLLDCLGLRQVFLIGICPGPLDRFSVPRDDFQKVSLGAEKNIKYRRFDDLKEAISFLREQKYKLVFIEQAFNSFDYKKFNLQPGEKYAFFFGPEVSGFSQAELREADIILEIPLKGGKESLNVFSAAAILLFRIFDK